MIIKRHFPWKIKQLRVAMIIYRRGNKRIPPQMLATRIRQNSAIVYTILHFIFPWGRAKPNKVNPKRHSQFTIGKLGVNKIVILIASLPKIHSNKLHSRYNSIGSG
jgi:hypothetical protein